jgi:hypothetical protein
MKKILLTLVVIGLLGAYPIAKYLTVETIEIKVQKTERITDGDESRYLIYTEDETFENTDTILFWKFDSSDVYGHMKEGEIYRVKVTGWRWKITSSYRNILSVDA